MKDNRTTLPCNSGGKARPVIASWRSRAAAGPKSGRRLDASAGCARRNRPRSTRTGMVRMLHLVPARVHHHVFRLLDGGPIDLLDRENRDTATVLVDKSDNLNVLIADGIVDVLRYRGGCGRAGNRIGCGSILG